MPILESVTYSAKLNNDSQEVYLYYKNSYLKLNKIFKINELDKLTMELFTRETIGNYTSDPYAKNDHKYSKEMQEIRKELRKLDQETKKDGGVVDWNRMLNDFM